jgi:hypothetical protein
VIANWEADPPLLWVYVKPVSMIPYRVTEFCAWAWMLAKAIARVATDRAIFFVMGTCLGSLMGSSEADNKTSSGNQK